MAKLHFYHGPMGSSKSARLLMTRFNYIEKGRVVLLLKPSTDTRDGVATIKSRIGLQAEAVVVKPEDDIFSYYVRNGHADVVIVDEAQFITPEQAEQLRNIASFYDTPVLCFGLRTDFRHKLFTGSKALFELADDIEEIKSICKCGEKAMINARLDPMGNVITEGEQVELGGNEKYESMCWACYIRKVAHQKIEE